MDIQTKPLSVITTEAIRVLNHHIGVANTLRFLNQFTTGFGNYTEERKELFDHLSLDDITTEIKGMRSQNP